jgi:hypothetical protein
MKTISFVMGLVGAAALVTACSAQQEDDVLVDPSSKLAPLSGNPDLSVTGSATATACVAPGTALVTFKGTLTSSSAGSWVDVTTTVDGVALPTWRDQFRWKNLGGGVKTHNYSYDLTLTNGTHSVQICFNQPGNDVTATEPSCTGLMEVTVDCETGTSCTQEGPFGETIGNKNLCRSAGKGSPRVNVQAKGDFGGSATLKITLPGSTWPGITTPIKRSGLSCVYHYNWATQNKNGTPNNGGTGLYHFEISGNGQTSGWDAELFCATNN